ncbi:MAG: SDR family oxidoreductase [Planctomycetota bacterium]
MRALFIGGTGNISSACSRLALEQGWELHLLNRGRSGSTIPGATSIVADITDEAAVAAAIGDTRYDVVANFIAFDAADIERDHRLFGSRCGQYIFVSSASAYQKPQGHYLVTESTPLVNPYWEYSRKKIAAELACQRLFRDSGFPITIVRPSLTYDTVIPLTLASWTDWTMIQRMRDGKPVIVPGDGSTLWTITHSADFAIAFLGLMGHHKAIGDSFHITSDEVLNWNQIHELTAAAAGVDSIDIVYIPSRDIARVLPWELGSLTGDKSVSAVFDNSKVKTLVPHFHAGIRYQEGIARTLAWFEADPARISVNQTIDGKLDAMVAAQRDFAAALDALRL